MKLVFEAFLPFFWVAVGLWPVHQVSSENEQYRDHESLWMYATFPDDCKENRKKLAFNCFVLLIHQFENGLWTDKSLQRRMALKILRHLKNLLILSYLTSCHRWEDADELYTATSPHEASGNHCSSFVWSTRTHRGSHQCSICSSKYCLTITTFCIGI